MKKYSESKGFDPTILVMVPIIISVILTFFNVDYFIELISFNNLAILITFIIFNFSISGICFSASRSVEGEYEQTKFTSSGKLILIGGFYFVFSSIFLLLYYKLSLLATGSEPIYFDIFRALSLCIYFLFNFFGLIHLILPLIDIFKICLNQNFYANLSMDDEEIGVIFNFYKKEMNRKIKNLNLYNDFGRLKRMHIWQNKSLSDEITIGFIFEFNFKEKFISYIWNYKSEDKSNLNLRFYDTIKRGTIVMVFELDKKFYLQDYAHIIFEEFEEFFIQYSKELNSRDNSGNYAR